MTDSNSAPPRPPMPVPKPRTKLNLNLEQDNDSVVSRPNVSPNSSASSSPSGTMTRVPPPRPPPPRSQLPLMSPRPSVLQSQQWSPEPPALPPRPDGKISHPSFEVLSYSVSHAPSDQHPCTSSDPFDDPFYTDCPKNPPPLGWNVHKLSMDDNEDPLQPLINLPNGHVTEYRMTPPKASIRPFGALLPDRPDIDHPEPPRPKVSGHPITSSIKLFDSPNSSDLPSEILSTLPPPLLPRIEYVENPVYLNLSTFRKFVGFSEPGPSHIASTLTQAIATSNSITPHFPFETSTIELRNAEDSVTQAKFPVTTLALSHSTNGTFPLKFVPSVPLVIPPNQLVAPKLDSPPAPEAPPRSPLPNRHDNPLPVLMSIPRGPVPLSPIQRDSVEFSEPKELMMPEIPFRPDENTSGINQLYASDAFNIDSVMFSSVDVADENEVEEDIIELVQSENEEDIESSVADGLSVCFSGNAEYYCGKKDKKLVHVRLRNMAIAVYENEEAEEPFVGPFDLPKAEFVGKQTDTNTIVCRFTSIDRHDSKVKSSREKDKESQKELKFTPLEQLESWMFMLAQCWLSSCDGLRSCVTDGMSCCGRMWLRQGTTSMWTHAVAFLHNMHLFYVVVDSAETTYELDIRKIVTIKSKLDPSESCPLAKKKDKSKDKGSGGPFLITVDSGSLCIECDDAVSSVLWLRSLEFALSKQPTTLEECRLCVDDVPTLVDKCIKFVASYGLSQEGIYRRNGKITEAKEIMKQLLQEPAEYFIVKETDETVFAVADVLRQFLRRLDAPLFPLEFHEELFDIYKSDKSLADKCADYRATFQKFPVINYSTIRRLMGHLKDVTQNSAINKATNDNVAKIFGPSVFTVEGKEDSSNILYKDTSYQIGVLVHLITEYASVFQITTREAITKAKLNMATHIGKQNKARAEGFLTAIHMWEKENRPFNVQSELVADEACREAISMRGFDAPTDSRYAIFEVLRNGALLRRLLPSEKLSSMVVRRWIDWNCPEAYFLFDHDNNPYDDQDISMFSGKVKVAEPGSRTFKSSEFRIEHCTKIALYRNGKLLHHWEVDDTIWYTGAEISRKAPHPFCLTFFHKPSTSVLDKSAGYCVSFKTHGERNQFLNAIHFAQTRGEPPLLVHF